MVVVVGTHIDIIKDFNKKKPALKRNVEEMFGDQFKPLLKGVHFVSCHVNHKASIQDLRKSLYEVARSIKTYVGELATYIRIYLTDAF